MSSDDVAAIELLKARYCRLLDTKDWEGFRALFADDLVADTSEAGGSIIEGADGYVAFVRNALRRAVTVHQVQQPEIELLSPTTARAVWAMQDVVRFAPGVTLFGFGHYHETYGYTEGTWRIASLKLTRLREEMRLPFVTFFVGNRMRRVMHAVSTRMIRD